MAEEANAAELKKNALIALEAARKEISDQWGSVQRELNPANVARAALKKNPGRIIASVTGLGFLIGWRLVRPKHTLPRQEIRKLATSAAQRAVSQAAAKPSVSFSPLAFLGPLAALAVKSALPILSRKLMEHIQDRMTQRTPPGYSGREPK